MLGERQISECGWNMECGFASLLIKNENNLKFDAMNFEPYVVS